MQMTPVSSSNLKAVGHENGVLRVEFLNGSVYDYHNVPHYIYNGLISAASHGGYLDQYVKKAGYNYTQIR